MDQSAWHIISLMEKFDMMISNTVYMSSYMYFVCQNAGENGVRLVRDTHVKEWYQAIDIEIENQPHA